MSYFQRFLAPANIESWWTNILIALPRILAGLLLAFEFGASKFGMPWSMTEEMGLFQVAAWFPEDVAAFGAPFSWAPQLFAWLGAATEAIGGLFLVLGLATRFWSLMLAGTMLTAIFLQKWPDVLEYGSSWPALPALGFLWIACYGLAFGSGKLGLDYLFFNKTK